jgi:FkbM family methyltransferase
MNQIMIALKSLVRRVFAIFGLKICKIHSTNTDELVLSLKHFEIDVVFDIGANAGQFAKDIRLAGYEGRIVCFEPLPSSHRALIENTVGDRKTTIHPRVAIGSSSETVKINISENLVSSSILEMLPAHLEAAPQSIYTGQVETAVVPLDAVFDEYASGDDVVFIKIDTQGYEWKVLDGASDSLSRSKGVLLELSLVPLYKDQHLWMDFLNRLETEGFSLWKIMEGFTHPVIGQSLQFDGVFFRLR